MYFIAKLSGAFIFSNYISIKHLSVSWFTEDLDLLVLAAKWIYPMGLFLLQLLF